MSATEIATAYVKLMPSTKGIEGSLTEAFGGESEKAGKNIGLNLASSIKTALVGLGLGKILKDSLLAGADLQQSMGGIETLFKSSSETMKAYATNAYQTAGISANQYMEQATSFGASLLQSLGGDTEKASTYANRAIMDMSDNANKMGTSIESIQNAYQGFAKGNYTMLDNLKLGYGGTKEEMQRLIQDTSKMTKEMKELGITVDAEDMSFGNITNAISVMQQHLGITGTTAKEAEGTFSGSFQMMKASAENLLASLTGVKDEGGNAILSVTESMTNLVKSASTFFFGNLVPMVVEIGLSIPQALYQGITSSMPMLLDKGRELFEFVERGIIVEAPNLIKQGTQAINDFVSGFLDGYPSILEKGGEIITTLVDAILRLMPTILRAGGDILMNLLQGIVSNLPTIIATSAQIIISIASAIWSNMPTILLTGIEVLGNLASGIISAIPDLVGQIPQVVESIKQAFLNTDWLSIGSNIINGIKSGITSALKGLVDAGLEACKSLADSVKGFFGIASPSKLFASYGRFIDEGLAIGLTNNMGVVHDAMGELENSTMGMIQSDLNISTNANLSSNNSIERVIYLLDTIAKKSSTIELNGRELGRELKEMGVSFV